MAFFKCSLCVCTLLCAGIAGLEAADVAKEAAPNGVRPFSIGHQVNPLEKVIDMIMKIRQTVRDEGQDEASIYDNFSCFCKDKTKRLEVMVHHHSKRIGVSSSTIADLTARTNEAHSDRKERKTNHEEFSSQLADNEQRLKQENANWQNIEADYSNNKHLIGEALKSLKDTKAVANGAFLQVPGMSKLKQVLEIGDAMGLIKLPKQQAIATSLLQGGNHQDPMASYGYHGGSDDVIDLVENMWDEMKDVHKQNTEDHTRASDSYRGMIRSLHRKIGENTEAIKQLERSDSKWAKKIAQMHQVLIENREDLKDTEDVFKEVTSACESRAREYSTRAAMRVQELIALNTALGALYKSHVLAKSQAPGDSLLQATPKSLPEPDHAQSKSTSKPNHAEIIEKAKALAKVDTGVKAKVPEKAGTKPLSFLQVPRGEHSPEDLKKRALGVLLSEGQRVKSLMLVALANKAGDDPFKKVKLLIEDLRWRLEKEEHAEVAKEVWCRAQVETSEHERNSQWRMANELSAAVLDLEARIETLARSVKYHGDKAKEIKKSIVQIYTDVAQLSAQQTEQMRVQKKARDEIQTAIDTLRSFYSSAAKAHKQEYTSISALQQEPTEEQHAQINRNFRKERVDIHAESRMRRKAEGKRAGVRHEKERNKIGDLEGDVPAMERQGSLGDAIALMETIVSDFDRELGNIQGDLDAEHRQLVEMNQVLRSQMEKAEELRDLDQMDLDSAKTKRDIKFNDMKTAMNLLDSALEEIEELKPTCIDTGMSYNERVKKREVEMTALKKALCILGDADNVC